MNKLLPSLGLLMLGIMSLFYALKPHPASGSDIYLAAVWIGIIILYKDEKS